jgi:aldehyde dehydrogenase (NAD+)
MFVFSLEERDPLSYLKVRTTLSERLRHRFRLIGIVLNSCADADIDQAAKMCAGSLLRNSGQICSTNTRVYVHESIAATFKDKYKEYIIATAKHGDPLDGNTTQGPLVDSLQFERVLSYIDSGKEEGKLLVGGKRKLSKGYFVEPTVFVDTPDSAKVNKEEIFGPVSKKALYFTSRNYS